MRKIIVNQEPVQQDEGWILAPIRALDPKPRVQLPTENRPLSQFAADVGRLCSGLGVYAFKGKPVLVEQPNFVPQPLTALKFVTWVEEYAAFTKNAPSDATPHQQQSLSVQDANIVLASPQFIRELPFLRKVNPLRLPTKNGQVDLRLLPVGHDPASGIFTLPSEIRFTATQSIADAQQYLNGLLSSLPFAEPVNGKSVLVATMLTVFALDLLPDNVEIPATIFTANGSGAGKTLCAKLCTIPVLGLMPTSPKPSSEAEMEKVLFASARDGARVIVLDNVKEHLSSAALEQFLTSSVISKRLLGKDVTESVSKKTAVLITGNDCTVSPDIRRRSLFVELFLEHARPEDRHIPDVLDEVAILRKRGEILTALYALVNAWYEAKCPPPTILSSTYQQWNNVIGAIVEHAGFGSPLAQSTAKDQSDPLLESMETLVLRLVERHGATEVKFEVLASLALSHGLFDTIIGTEGPFSKDQKTKLGKYLARQDRKIFRPGYRFIVQGKGHQRRFLVEATQAVTAGPITPSENVASTAVVPVTTATENVGSGGHGGHVDHDDRVPEGEHDGHDVHDEHDPSEAGAPSLTVSAANA